MNKNLLILGINSYGKTAENISREMGCFDEIRLIDTVFSDMGEYEQLVCEYSCAFVAVEDLTCKLRLIEQLESVGFTIVSLVSPKASIAKTAQLMKNTLVENGASIEDEVTVAIGCFISEGAVIKKNCFIGDGCYVGENAVVPSQSMVLADTKIQ